MTLSVEVIVTLRAAWKGTVTADNAEDGFARIRAIANTTMTNAEIAAAVADCLRQKLIREPVRLPEGALQCHWTLELTPAGVDAVREILTCES
jgi:hypothetical protein